MIQVLTYQSTVTDMSAVRHEILGESGAMLATPTACESTSAVSKNGHRDFSKDAGHARMRAEDGKVCLESSCYRIKSHSREKKGRIRHSRS